MFLAAGQAVWQRFGAGLVQAAGGFPHQNFLGMVSHFIVYPFFALLLAGERGWFPIAVSLVGAIVAILTASRATVAIAIFGYVAVFILSAARGWSARKSMAMVAAVFAAIALSPLVVSSFEQRFSSSSDLQSSIFEGDLTRDQMEDAARLMLADHPMGIGANHYVTAANNLGYNQKSGLTWANFGAYVHNAYLLVAAETGYLGLAAFAFLLLRPLMVAFICSWRNRRDKRGDLLLGLGVGLLTVYLHNFFEWIFVTFQCEYLFAVNAAMIAALAQRLGYWKQVQARPVQLVVEPPPAATQNYRLKSRR